MKYLILAFSILWSEIVFCQISVGFTSSDSVGCNSLIVQFNNTSQGDGDISYKWNFGNGTTSTMVNPQVVYNQIGSFSVTLIANKQQYSDTLIKENYINIYRNPEIKEIIATSEIGCLPLTTELSAIIEIGNAPISTMIWDFGDGNSSTQNQPEYTFLEDGKFTISLFVFDTNKCESNFSHQEFITTIAKPIINFTSIQNIACVDTLTVNFENTSYASSELSYFWDFGDSTTSIQELPAKFYSGFNNYTVKLIGTDIYGCIDSLVKPNYIRLQELKADIILLDNYLCKHEVLEIINNTYGANSYNWSFGDKTESILRNPIKQYQDTGIFEIEYIASFENYCSDTLVLYIYIDPVTAKFESDNNYGCEFPFTVQYIDSSINANNWHWIFENGTQSTQQHPKVNYIVTEMLNAKRNLYLTDTLIAESIMHCKDTFVIDSNVHLHYPSIYFTPNDSNTYKPLFSGCVPITVDFQNKSENYFDNDPFIQWEWNFGDTTFSHQNNPVHEYNYTGEYTVELTVTNRSGCMNSYNAILLAGSPQNAKFNYSGNTVICGSELTSFNNESNDELLIDKWKWKFSEGSNLEGKNPEIHFMDTGYISGNLSVFYNDCEGSTYQLDSFVYINGPAGNYQRSSICTEPLKYYFESNINGADFWYYDFGDNCFDSTQVLNINHEYVNTGDYNSSLKANNEENECSLYVEKKIQVRQLNIDYEYYPENICPGDTVFFNPKNSYDNTYFVNENKLGLYFWDFGDNSDKEMGFEIHNHIFENSGDYNVTLKIKDANSCEQNLTQTIKVYGVNANFSYSDTIGCAPFRIDFFDTSVSDTTLNNWYWQFSNGSIDTNKNNNQTFLQDGSYTVTLIVTDIIGCSDTVIKQNAIYSSNPIPKFKAVKVKNCFNDTVVFQNLSTGSLLKSFQWTFGNGETSYEFEPKIAYSDTGFFDISLLIIDSLGCDSQLVKAEYLYIQPNPIANFTANIFSSSCYPKVIGFNGASVSNDIKYRYWDFGDNEVNTNNASPYHTYQLPGTFDVKLKVETTIGCTDSIIKSDLINIGGPHADIVAPDTACINTPIKISFDNPLNIDNFIWTLDDGSTFTSDYFTKEYDAFGIKKVYLWLESDSLGTCNKMFVDSINIPVLMANYSLSDTAQCIPLTTNATNLSIGANKFQWFKNNILMSTAPDIELYLTELGTHSLMLIALNSTGCKDSISEKIVVYPLPRVIFSDDSLICQYDSIWLNASGGINYFWFEGNELIDSMISSINISPRRSTQYKIKVVDENTCINFDSVYITVQPKPIVNVLNNDTTLIIGEEIELKAIYSDGDNIEWEPLDYLSCINCEKAYALPLKTTNYKFKVSDRNNCFLISDSVFIKVDAKYSLDVPSSFSPNGDGINDILYIKGWGIKELIEFKIYSMMGRIVFETNEINEGWDGNSHIGNQPEGMYIYKANVISYDNITRSKQGYIYLIK